MSDVVSPPVVIITQPAPASDALCAAVRACGMVPLCMPAYQIVYRPLIDVKRCQQNWCQAKHVIVTSQHCVPSMRSLFSHQRRVWAVGPTTQQALEAAGCDTVQCPETYSSEGLLAMPALQQVATDDVMIFCGDNARPLLCDSLRERGAVCEQVICYHRERAIYTSDTLKQMAAEQPAVMTIHSADGLRFIAQALSQDKASPLWACPLLHVHARYVALAQELGFTGQQCVAKATDSAAMCAVLQSFNI